MLLIRMAQHTDLNDLYELATTMGPGITTFPPDMKALKQKIRDCETSCHEAPGRHKSQAFLLVLEDTSRNKVIGTAGVYNNIGASVPFYSYQILSQTQVNKEFGLRHTNRTLNLVHAVQGGTEVGTLLLDPEYNGRGLGKFLAKSRYLLITAFNNYFHEPVFAELRGWTDSDGKSPFWEALGRIFFDDLEFARADVMSGTTDNQFIADMIPRHPIYVDLLPPDVQEIIGKPHDKGRAALQMLYKEGFRDTGLIDIFDSGVTVTAQLADLETYSNSKAFLLTEISSSITSQQPMAYICNDNLPNFRVIQTDRYAIIDNGITLHEKDAHALGSSINDTIHLYRL